MHMGSYSVTCHPTEVRILRPSLALVFCVCFFTCDRVLRFALYRTYNIGPNADVCTILRVNDKDNEILPLKHVY